MLLFFFLSVCECVSLCLLLGIGMDLRWLEASPVTLISQTVVCRPHRVIWPRCRWSLCCQTLSWKHFLLLSLQLLYFPFDSSSGVSHKNRISARVGSFERTCLNLGVLSGGVLSTAFCLAITFPLGHTLSSVLQNPVWACFVIFQLHLFCSLW